MMICMSLQCQPSRHTAGGVGVRELVAGQGATPAVNQSGLCSTSISVRRKAGFRVVSEKQTAGFTDRTLI